MKLNTDVAARNKQNNKICLLNYKNSESNKITSVAAKYLNQTKWQSELNTRSTKLD
jgi:hypothetical protein